MLKAVTSRNSIILPFSNNSSTPDSTEKVVLIMINWDTVSIGVTMPQTNSRLASSSSQRSFLACGSGMRCNSLTEGFFIEIYGPG